MLHIFKKWWKLHLVAMATELENMKVLRCLTVILSLKSPFFNLIIFHNKVVLLLLLLDSFLIFMNNF